MESKNDGTEKRAPRVRHVVDRAIVSVSRQFFPLMSQVGKYGIHESKAAPVQVRPRLWGKAAWN